MHLDFVAYGVLGPGDQEEGMALYINDYRVAGPKPWGGGVVRHEWSMTDEDLATALRSR